MKSIVESGAAAAAAAAAAATVDFLFIAVICLMLYITLYWFNRLFYKTFHFYNTFSKNQPDPMWKKARAVECTIQNLNYIWIVHLIAFDFLHMGYKFYSCNSIYILVCIYIYICIWLYIYIFLIHFFKWLLIYIYIVVNKIIYIYIYLWYIIYYILYRKVDKINIIYTYTYICCGLVK